jgi:hypothetical protein
MKRSWLTLINVVLATTILWQAVAFASSSCPPSSACPGSDENCDRQIDTQYYVCKTLTSPSGCCKWLKVVFKYVSKPGKTCTRPPCGQYDGASTPANGTFQSGETCYASGSPAPPNTVTRGTCLASSPP